MSAEIDWNAVKQHGVDGCRLRTEIDAARMAVTDDNHEVAQMDWVACLAQARSELGASNERDVHEYAARIYHGIPPAKAKPPMTPEEWAACRGGQALYFYRLGGSARGLDEFIADAHSAYYYDTPEVSSRVSEQALAELVRAAFEKAKRNAESLRAPSIVIYGSTPGLAIGHDRTSAALHRSLSDAATAHIRKATSLDIGSHEFTTLWVRLMKAPKSEWPTIVPTTTKESEQ